MHAGDVMPILRGKNSILASRIMSSFLMPRAKVRMAAVCQVCKKKATSVWCVI
jgi:hypothetical protein